MAKVQLIAAPFTPFRTDGQLATERIDRLVENLLSVGVDGIFVCGSTGEGPSLTRRERELTAEAFVEAAAGKMKVFVHVGHNSVYESADLARHAAAIGADAISATVPTYYPIVDARALLDTIGFVARQVPELPFYYYVIPRLTGLVSNTAEFIDMARRAIPNLAGIKFTSPYINAFQFCLQEYGDDLDLYYGQDEMMLSALAVGATGFIGSTYNFATPKYRRLLTHVERGDLAAAADEQAGIVEMVNAIDRYGGLPAQKAMMAMVGLDCGPVRPPLRNLTGAEQQGLQRELERIGFFDWQEAIPSPDGLGQVIIRQ
jgi:N-acetylneuraminate lyase